jgi:Putative zinc-finger
MGACSDHKKILVLDAHGALTPEERTALEQHLAVCDDCRHKRERLGALLLSAKETLSVPGLTAAEEQFLSAQVQRSLRTAEPQARPARLGWWLAPAFAACMVLLVAGWFGLKNFGSDTVAINTTRAPEKVVSNNKKLPENAGNIAAIKAQRVPDVQVIINNNELLEEPGTDTAAITPEPTPEEIIRTNKELLENMDLLQDMESLEQLVNLLDKQEQDTSVRERGDNADRFRANA